jgi:hypothetical protein
MNVIWHKAISPESHASFVSVLSQEMKVKRIVVVFEENLLASVASLDEMIRNSRDYYPRDSRHGQAPLWVSRLFFFVFIDFLIDGIMGSIFSNEDK